MKEGARSMVGEGARAWVCEWGRGPGARWGRGAGEGVSVSAWLLCEWVLV